MAHLRSHDGYPARYHEAIRRSWRFSLWLASVTLLVAGIALAATLYLDLPAVFAAAALAVCLLIGLFGNVVSLLDVRSVRLVPYFQRTVREIDTYLSGKALARNLQFLDDLAAERGVAALSSFGFADDLLGEPLVWHSPAQGLQTCRALLDALTQGASPVDHVPTVVEELTRLEHALQLARDQQIQFCLLLLHGNTTSGHEWSIRKGTAF